MRNFKKIAVSFLLGVAFASTPYFTAEEISAEALYNIKLSAGVVEVDINEIPDDRVVSVPVYIDNNPGFLGLGFIIEKDNNLNFIDNMPASSNDNFGISNTPLHNTENIYYISLGAGNRTYNLYYDNGYITSIDLKLPESLHTGDYFNLNLIKYHNDGDMDFECNICTQNDFDHIYYSDNFESLTNGGIKIVGSEIIPETEPPQTQAPETQMQEQERQPENNNDNTHFEEKTTEQNIPTITSTINTSVSETSSESLTTSEISSSSSAESSIVTTISSTVSSIFESTSILTSPFTNYSETTTSLILENTEIKEEHKVLKIIFILLLISSTTFSIYLIKKRGNQNV